MKRNPDIREYTRAFYRSNRLAFAAAIFMTMLTVIPNLVFSWLLGAIIDTIAVRQSGELLRLLLLVALPLLAFMSLIELGKARLKCRFIHRAMAQYKSLAFSRLSEKSISAFSSENTGRYLSALTNDASSIEADYLSGTISIVFYIALFFATLLMMIWYSWQLTLFALVFSLIPILISVLMGGENARRQRAVSDQNEKFVSVVKDILNGFPVVKSFKAERQIGQLFDEANRSAERTKQRRRWWSLLLNSAAAVSGTALQFGVFFFGAYLAIRGNITAGTVLIFVNLCNFVIQPINTVPQFWAERKAARALIEKLAAATAEHTGREGQAIPSHLSQAIEFSHVTFGYEPGKPVLRDLSLRLEPGKKYAVVGVSGSGKSTLLNLLMGAYDGYEGSLTIDGVQLRDIHTDSLYDLMSLIGQNVFLFDDTLQNNVTLFREFPEQQVEAALRRSGLSELADQRGMDYPCGENGVNLSGGERQRVSIARCLLRGTPVLMLDEATAALDNRTAFAVTDAILRLDGLTRLVVTHRLDAALMEQYDEIIVLRGGEIQEQGTFERLMAQKGYFYSLFTLAA